MRQQCEAVAKQFSYFADVSSADITPGDLELFCISLWIDFLAKTYFLHQECQLVP